MLVDRINHDGFTWVTHVSKQQQISMFFIYQRSGTLKRVISGGLRVLRKVKVQRITNSNSAKTFFAGKSALDFFCVGLIRIMCERTDQDRELRFIGDWLLAIPAR